MIGLASLCADAYSRRLPTLSKVCSLRSGELDIPASFLRGLTVFRESDDDSINRPIRVWTVRSEVTCVGLFLEVIQPGMGWVKHAVSVSSVKLQLSHPQGSARPRRRPGRRRGS